MKKPKDFKITQIPFSNTVHSSLETDPFATNFWPLVYILSNENSKQAYVGETTDVITRMDAHLANPEKAKLTSVHFIGSEKFNKSATLDIESNLIKYISGDGQYDLLNGNIGLSNHNYFQKGEVYWDLFKSIWSELRGLGITKHSLEHIDNSDLFKYSPYKSLTPEQSRALLTIIDNLLDHSSQTSLVEGGAGTGKTILAIFLFKMMHSDFDEMRYSEFGELEEIFVQKILELKERFPKPKMALVVPMSSFRNTLQKVFKNIKGLNSSMVIGPADVARNSYDILMVDESHRLRRRINLGSYFAGFDKASAILGFDKHICSELDWVKKQSRKLILFYDANQSVKPSDANPSQFRDLRDVPSTRFVKLKSQLRVRGGNEYVQFVHDLLQGQSPKTLMKIESSKYEFLLFDSLSEMIDELKARENLVGLSRLIAGYSWPWVSKTDDSKFDIDLDGVTLKWNAVNQDWINSKNAINEVGCIHTTQGYDLNYAGIIFGQEITFNPANQTIEILKDNYHDRNGKSSIKDPQELKTYILNIYKTIMLRGIKGTFVYVSDRNLRDYFRRFIPVYNANIIDLNTSYEATEPFVNAIPFYNIQVAAGAFSEPAAPGETDWIRLPDGMKASQDLFACKVYGESMNEVIPSGSLCLFSKDRGGSRNGKIVLVQHQDIQDPDFGAGFTVKEYYSVKKVGEDGWEHTEIRLKPKSRDSNHKEIIVNEDSGENLKVLGVFQRVLLR